MKKLIYILVTLAFFGCDDFLEETSQNQIRPSTVSDMEKILEIRNSVFFKPENGKACCEERGFSKRPIREKHGLFKRYTEGADSAMEGAGY